MLTISSYTANLAAVLSYTPLAVPLIGSINDFSLNNLPACVSNNTDVISFMGTFYPGIRLHVVPGTYTADLLHAVLDPDSPCPAAVAPDLLLKFTMGPEGDPNSTFCSLVITGAVLNQGFFSIPFRNSLPLAQLDSLNALVSEVINNGMYDQAQLAENDFPTERPNCQGATATAGSGLNGGALTSALPV